MDEINRRKLTRLNRIQNWFTALSLLGFVSLPILIPLAMEWIHAALGFWARTAFGILALVGYFKLFLIPFFRIDSWIDRQLRDIARDQFAGIYRVIAMPQDARRCLWEFEPIKVGDFGWEGVDRASDGLILLQGVSREWGVLWSARFRRDEIEYVAHKPVSQYDWRDFEYPLYRPVSALQCGVVNPVVPCPYPVDVASGPLGPRTGNYPMIILY